jgi:hypothetical protein
MRDVVSYVVSTRLRCNSLNRHALLRFGDFSFPSGQSFPLSDAAAPAMNRKPIMRRQTTSLSWMKRAYHGTGGIASAAECLQLLQD